MEDPTFEFGQSFACADNFKMVVSEYSILYRKKNQILHK